jgi:hypothetical protein
VELTVRESDEQLWQEHRLLVEEGPLDSTCRSVRLSPRGYEDILHATYIAALLACQYSSGDVCR